MTRFERISSAIIYTLWKSDENSIGNLAKINDCVNFVNHQFRQLPDYLHLPFNILAIGLDVLSMVLNHKTFCNLGQNERKKIIDIWTSLAAPTKDFIFAYDTLAQFYLYSSMNTQNDEEKHHAR